MKTPREILLQSHQSVEPKLDAVRQKALEGLTPARTLAREKATPGFREMLLSFRWHLAGMSAAWVLVALLNIDHSPSPVAAIVKERIPSTQQLLAALRENRRQLAELLESSANVSEPSPAPPSFVPKRRGEIRSTNSMALYG